MWCKIDFPLSLKLHTELQHPFKHQTQTPPHTQNEQNTINYTITSVSEPFAIFITNFYPPFFHCTICFRFSLPTRKLKYNFMGWVFQCIFATLSNPFVTKVHSMKVLIKVRLFTTVIIWIYTKFHIVLFVSSSKAIFHFYFW